MKFIIDAQLPKSLAVWLRQRGHDVVHTLELPSKNATDDLEINELSLREKRIVISKDSDFFDRYFQKTEPYKLLFLTVGNLSNKALLQLFDDNLDKITSALDTHFVVEINRNSLIVID